jgi:hypothetical protein
MWCTIQAMRLQFIWLTFWLSGGFIGATSLAFIVLFPYFSKCKNRATLFAALLMPAVSMLFAFVSELLHWQLLGSGPDVESLFSLTPFVVAAYCFSIIFKTLLREGIFSDTKMLIVSLTGLALVLWALWVAWLATDSCFLGACV